MNRPKQQLSDMRADSAFPPTISVRKDTVGVASTFTTENREGLSAETDVLGDKEDCEAVRQPKTSSANFSFAEGSFDEVGVFLASFVFCVVISKAILWDLENECCHFLVSGTYPSTISSLRFSFSLPVPGSCEP